MGYGDLLVNAGYLAVAGLSLLAMLAITVVSKSRWLEGAAGIVCSALLLMIHATNFSVAWLNIERLLPTVLFLGFCLSFAQLCEKEKLFEYLGDFIGRQSRGNSKVLFVLVFALSAVVTSVLSLDATVLLLTPIVLQAASRLGIDHRPFAYATGHLANTASMLLPISNLTNLLLIAYGNISFISFIRLSWLPWIVALAAEFLVLFIIFHKSLNSKRNISNRPQENPLATAHPPMFAIAVVALTLIGFIVTGIVDIPPFWVAMSGCIILMLRRIRSKKSGISEELRVTWKAFNISFLIFVLSLSVVIAVLSSNGLNVLLLPLFHQPVSLDSLLLIAAVSVMASNVMNNLPAAMLLLPLAASQSPIMAMAVLIGVNIGPNLTYVGSLANILWRRILLRRGNQVELLQFSWIGLITTFSCIISSILALWISAAM
ncbi:SLC13 family permease [Bifidobacterium aquikefiri]|uniref:SLC13 family permease n=1 Tax=Bifidobacterium aquikefiri TaxID=1653207 RepID=UPI0039ECBD41